MYKYNKKISSWLFGILFLLGIILFTVFGATFAYFQIKPEVEKAYQVGYVGAYWINGTKIENGTTCQLNTSGEPLVRGDDAGISILDASGNAGGMLQIAPETNAQEQYVRISYKTLIGGVNVDLGENLVFRIAITSGSTTTYVALGDENSSWQKCSDGWYYYIGAYGVVTNADVPIDICNNVMLVALDQQYLEKDLEIQFTFETLQAANNPVESVWGSDAKALYDGIE